MPKYYSQIGQDQYYIENIINFRKNGFYVDIGANNGLHTSNTAALDLELNWNGICVEANPLLIADLKKNRPNAIIVEAACWKTDEIVELEITDSNNNGIEGHLLSRIANLGRDQKQFLSHFQTDKKIVKVQGKTVNSIVQENYYMPCVIDYLSIDTEGSELEILQSIDYTKIDIKFMTVEHGKRKGYLHEIESFLNSKGFKLHRMNQWDAEFSK
jgi:FkbM family methyltransferase